MYIKTAKCRHGHTFLCRHSFRSNWPALRAPAWLVSPVGWAKIYILILAEFTIENAFFSRNVAFWRIFWVCQLVTSYKTQHFCWKTGFIWQTRIKKMLPLFKLSKYADEAFVNFVAFLLVNNEHYPCLNGRHSTVNNSR